jgi:hypothetical protein
MAVNNLNTGVGIQPTIVDAKGDLIAATANDAVNRLAVGTNGQVLVADSGETTGLKWNDPGTVGGLVHINTTSFSAVASQNINNIFSATYDSYKIYLTFTTASSADNAVYIKLRASGTDASTNYVWGYPSITIGGSVSSFNGSAQTTGFIVTTMDAGTSGYSHSSEITFNNPFAAGFTSGQINFAARNTSGVFIGAAGAMVHETATSYDGINIIASAGNITGQCVVLGVRK